MSFSNAKVRCSSIGKIMTEPRDKKDKESGALSATALSCLTEIYVSEKYGRVKDIQSKPMKKGTEVEDDSIATLSVFDGNIYEKNKERFENDYITGTPDIIFGEKVIDVKSSYDLWTFLANLQSSIDKDYYWQLQGYMWLTGAQVGEIAYVLSDMPEQMLQDEKYYLLRKMNVVTEESPEFIKAAAELEKRLTFSDISIKEKVIKLKVNRNDNDIELIAAKVEKIRIALAHFENLHKNQSNA